MERQENNDFKYVIQDTSCVYFGKELTYTEMINRKDVPFKFQALISTQIAKDTGLEVKMADHILAVSPDEFSYRIFEQLKLTVRVFYKTQKNGPGGKIKEKWVHKSCPLRQFCKEYRNKVLDGDVMIEDISISKLALMMFNI